MNKPNLESVQDQDIQYLFGNLWELTKVETIAASSRNALVGGPFGSNLVSKDYTESGIPVIRGQNMALGRWVSGEFAYVSEEKARQLAPNTARPGDLIFTQRGTLGQVAVVPEGEFEKYIISQSQMKLTPDIERCDVMFLYYFFSSPAMQTYMLTNSIQVGVPHTNLSILKGAPVVVPPLLIQREIAHILGILDDKIDLNRRMNATLESMARALFKSWFVDFDPVRAKAEGRQPDGIDAETAALFPDSFEDSDLGPIPAGWRILSLDQIANFLNGLALQKFPPQDDEWLPVIKIRELRQGFADDSSNQASTRIKSDYIIEDGDIIFSWSGSLLLDVWCGGKGALNQHLFKVTSNDFPRWFYYYWVQHHLTQFIEIAANKATTMGHIQRHHLAEALCVVPSLDVITALGEVIRPIFDAVTQSRLQSRTLATTRDALLPRLMSGERLTSSDLS